MANISKKLSKLISSQQTKMISSGVILPVKTVGGILIGSVKIVQEGTVKHLYNHGELVYTNISLNTVAICMANLIAIKKNTHTVDVLYQADQEYSKWYNDCEMLMASRRQALKSKDYDRVDMLLARYQESRLKAVSAKKIVERLLQN